MYQALCVIEHRNLVLASECCPHNVSDKGALV